MSNLDPLSTLQTSIQSSSVWKNATRSVNQMNKSNSCGNLIENSKPKRIGGYDGPIGTLSGQWDGYLFAAENGNDSVNSGNNASNVSDYNSATNANNSTNNNTNNSANSNVSNSWRGNLHRYLIITLNESCLPSAGVEAVLKWNKLKGCELNDGVDSLGFDEFDAGGAGLGGASGTSGAGTEGICGGAVGATGGGSAATKAPGFGILRALKKTHIAIERSVTTMAIRADGGKNRDWICVALVYRGSLNCNEANVGFWGALGQSFNGSGSGVGFGGSGSGFGGQSQEVCLSKTEWVQLPLSNENNLTFNIPLSVPDLSFLQTPNGGIRLTLRMYIRSGALLNIVKREYACGECTIQYSNIVNMCPDVNRVFSNSVNLPFTSGMLSESHAAIKVVTTARMKFVPNCMMGWSLTDVTSTAPTTNNSWMKMFHLPLDQAYTYPILNHHQLMNSHRLTGWSSNSSILICNERACESTLVLPIATAVSWVMGRAAGVSAEIAGGMARSARDFVRDDGNAQLETTIKEGCVVEVGVVGLILENGIGPPASAMMTFQRCDSIFEENLISAFSLPLLDKTAEVVSSALPKEAAVKKFWTKIYSQNDVLPGVVGTSSHGYAGSIRCAIVASIEDASIGQSMTSIEGIVPLEPYLNPGTQRPEKIPVLAPAMDANSGKVVGKILFLLRVKSLGNGGANAVPDARDGLISMMGLNTLTEDMGVIRQLDNITKSNTGVRQRQVATMGSFLTPTFLKYHSEQRSKDAAIFKHRFEKYYNSLIPSSNEDESDVPLFKRRMPKPFRPSHSRQDALLAGIGFNVHVQALTLHLLQDGQEGLPAAVTCSVTHGAPSDHARGFGVYENEDVPSSDAARGGLRRLELARLEFAREVEDNMTGLIGAVGDYFNMRAQASAARQRAGVKTSRHVPTNIQACNYYRNRLIESMQKLHSLTWEVSVRRVNCFSQALGIAVTSYLTSLSDGGPAWRFANVWAQHGYLITFEGLLSAVGKELGMIEDASTAVEMLRMVSVVLVPVDNNNVSGRIPVVHSPFVRYVHLQKQATPTGTGAETQYKLEIALDPTYFQKRVPTPLQGTPVRFVPVLFQMGVDIRQWGANAGRNVTTQIKDRTKAAGEVNECCADVEVNNEPSPMPVCGLIDDGDEDDIGGPADTEILVTLNLEGFRKLNVYAHTVNPTPTTPPSVSTMSIEQMQSLPAHPLLSVLSDTIKSSAGKMEHGVLDHAATSCQRLGGGSTVFCKSGKDRTAMQVTFKQSQFLHRFIEKKDANTPLEDVQPSPDDVFVDSTLMRIHGTRVPICEKNAGESKYAFNPLQAKFMPDALKPPPIALAGFLKKPET